MRSEIPQIEVITAIADADFEDFVAQLLFSQGWSIIFRAFDAQTLEEFLVSRRSLRTVIIYKADLPGFKSDSIMDYENDPFTFISLDGSEQAAHSFVVHWFKVLHHNSSNTKAATESGERRAGLHQRFSQLPVALGLPVEPLLHSLSVASYLQRTPSESE